MTELSHIVRAVLEGSDVDRDALLADYPEHAEELRRLFRHVDNVEAAIGCGATDPPAFEFQGIRAEGPVDVRLPGVTQVTLSGFLMGPKIHEGSQGAVYRAVQLSTGRQVALKLRLSRCETARIYFQREIAAAARLRHPNIAAIHEAGVTEDGRAFLAMEYVEGATLAAYLRARPALTLHERLDLWAQVCEGVRHAHQNGVIHRDINPSNVLVDEAGTPRLVDFGVATLRHVEELHPGAPVGTPGYIPPEIRSGLLKTADVRGDVYALGMLGHEILTGRTLSEGEAPYLVDADLNAILSKALQIDPDRRYQEVGALLTEIGQFQAGDPLAQRQADLLYVLRKVLWKRRRVAGLLVALAAAMAVLAAVVRDRDSLQETMSASALRRYEIARLADFEALAAYQDQVRQANVFAAVKTLPAAAGAQYAIRYDGQVTGSVGVFEPVVDGAPADSWAALHDEGHAEHAAALTWMNDAEARLDELSSRLATSAVRFGLDERMGFWGLEWAKEPIRPACQVCAAFVARARRRFAGGDHAGAVGDLTAARRIAADLGDGVLMEHKVWSALCLDRIYTCVQRILTEGTGRPGEAAPYVEWMLADPDVVSFAPALLSRRMGLTELINAAMVSDGPHDPEWFDLKQLDRFLNGYLAGMGALKPGHVTRARAMRAGELNALIDHYVSDTRAWESLTSVEISRKLNALTAELESQRRRLALLWIFDVPAEYFLGRRRTQSRRDALRIVAASFERFAGSGRWPERLEELKDSGVAVMDRRTGHPFGFEPTPTGPCVTSEATDDLMAADRRSMEWLRLEDRRLVYFPARVRD
ncbi:MAG: serine/threonine protein kinase [Phycisphaerales bacterium]|nr:MAG: serine/threonine protein kinase [Phycisphaerales bacterium]